MGAVTKEMEKKQNKTAIRRGRTEIHRDQAIVERFNRTLAERLFGHQYAVEMRLPEGQRSTAWVKRLPEVVSALNNEVTSLIGKKPAEAIKEKAVYSKRALTKPGTWNIPEHSGTFRNRANYHKINEKKSNKRILIVDKR